mmetsp:Transcript_88101/g.235721  ORF Transcript_88101/g.235721 Transcript_88101/m.235721 type:complete len:201 (+) Transcript_88101:1119-1721(+)
MSAMLTSGWYFLTTGCSNSLTFASSSSSAGAVCRVPWDPVCVCWHHVAASLNPSSVISAAQLCNTATLRKSPRKSRQSCRRVSRDCDAVNLFSGGISRFLCFFPFNMLIRWGRTGRGASTVPRMSRWVGASVSPTRASRPAAPTVPWTWKLAFWVPKVQARSILLTISGVMPFSSHLSARARCLLYTSLFRSTSSGESHV